MTTKYAITNPWLYNFLWTATTLVLTVPVALINRVNFAQNLIIIFIASLFSALWYIFFTFATYKLDLTTLIPLFNMRVVFTLILSFFILGESLAPKQCIWCGLILLGGVLVSLDERLGIKLSTLIGITAMFFLSLNEVFIKKVFIHNDLWTGTLWMGIVTQLILSLTSGFFIKDLKKLRLKQFFPVVIMSFFGVVGNLTANMAYKVNVGIAAIILSLPISMILVFVLSSVKPNLLGKHTFKIYLIRFTAALVMIISALKLTF